MRRARRLTLTDSSSLSSNVVRRGRREPTRIRVDGIEAGVEEVSIVAVDTVGRLESEVVVLIVVSTDSDLEADTVDGAPRTIPITQRESDMV